MIMKKSLLFFCIISFTISSCSDDPVTGGGNLNNENCKENFYNFELKVIQLIAISIIFMFSTFLNYPVS